MNQASPVCVCVCVCEGGGFGDAITFLHCHVLRHQFDRKQGVAGVTFRSPVAHQQGQHFCSPEAPGSFTALGEQLNCV